MDTAGILRLIRSPALSDEERAAEAAEEVCEVAIDHFARQCAPLIQALVEAKAKRAIYLHPELERLLERALVAHMEWDRCELEAERLSLAALGKSGAW